MDIATLQSEIEIFLKGYFEDQVKKAGEIDRGYEDLWKSIEAVTLAGGKRLRPYIFVLSYMAYGGIVDKTILQVAAAHELLHVFLLVHDDVIDRDTFRHGQLNISGRMRQKYSGLGRSAGHFADSAAMLGGDIIMMAAFDTVATSDLNATSQMTVIRNMLKAVQSVGAGELMDYESSMKPFKEADSVKIAENKTSSYSFILPLVNGASLADAAAVELEKLTKIGLLLGIAFQLRDDVIGIYTDKKVTGKSQLSDVEEGKRTYIMQQAVLSADEGQRKILDKSLGNPKLSMRDFKQVLKVLDDTKAKAKTEAKIKQYSEEALDILASLEMDEEIKDKLMLLIKTLINRDI